MGELNRRKKNVECSGDNIKGELEKWMLFVGAHTQHTALNGAEGHKIVVSGNL